MSSHDGSSSSIGFRFEVPTTGFEHMQVDRSSEIVSRIVTDTIISFKHKIKDNFSKNIQREKKGIYMFY